ncbi:MAG: hypothetical protein U1D55_04095 [Phycisphaerae bacterium]
MASFGRAKRLWIKTFLHPPHGVPSGATPGAASRGSTRRDQARLRRLDERAGQE